MVYKNKKTEKYLEWKMLLKLLSSNPKQKVNEPVYKRRFGSKIISNAL